MENKAEVKTAKTNVLKAKSEALSVRIMKMDFYLKKQTDCPSNISNQILRSGTSIGANIAESFNAESKLDFIHKLSVALKEADETLSWAKNIKVCYNVNQEAFSTLINDINEIRYILIASIKTSKANMVKSSSHKEDNI